METELTPIQTDSTVTANDGRQEIKWFVMRDQKRYNALTPAYSMLERKGFEVFTPMKWQLVKRFGHRLKIETPVIRDLLFVRSSEELLDPEVQANATLQYRYLKGGYMRKMIVRDKDMDKFIKAAGSTDDPVYYLPGEITPNMIGRKVRLIGGALDGSEVRLIKTQGSKTKRIFVDLPMLLAVSVEVAPEFIEFID